MHGCTFLACSFFKRPILETTKKHSMVNCEGFHLWFSFLKPNLDSAAAITAVICSTPGDLLNTCR